MQLTNEEFDKLITRAMDELPQGYIRGLENVVIVYEDEPTEAQRIKMKLDDNYLLLGLYEGIPLTERGGGYSLVLPDKITLFKNSILASVDNEDALFEQVKRTLWHEMAHFYGVSHERMDALQNRSNS